MAPTVLNIFKMFKTVPRATAVVAFPCAQISNYTQKASYLPAPAGAVAV